MKWVRAFTPVGAIAPIPAPARRQGHTTEPAKCCRADHSGRL